MNSIPSRRSDGNTVRAPRSSAAQWLQRNHARLSGSMGGVMLFLAVLTPIIAPADMRSEVLIITVVFGFAGALMLYSAVDSSNRLPAPLKRVKPAISASPASKRAPAKAIMKYQQVRRDRARAVAGLAFGLLFMLAGVFAPFLLSEGNANPDARFLMMIGFSPVAISGVLMVGVFSRVLGFMPLYKTGVNATAGAGRQSDAKTDSITTTMGTVAIISGMLLSGCAVMLPFIVNEASRSSIATPTAVMGGLGMALSLSGGWLIRRERNTTAAVPIPGAAPAEKPVVRRAPVQRVPGNILYRLIVPVAIVLMLVLIVAVILVVIAATVTPFVK